MAPSPKKKKPHNNNNNNNSVRRASSRASGHSRNSSATKTEVIINVYDLLPPGRLSSLLWTVGGSLLHSGVVINDREYAYGGHNKRNVTGVYYTRPKYEPPGGTHRLSILQGFTFHAPHEIERILKQVSDDFLGPSYNLLTHNCNHFTSALVTALTGKAAPAWLNRAASIGLALPCMVPREWISPPDVETADGALLEGQEGRHNEDDDAIETARYKDDDDDADERASMLETERHARLRDEQRRAREEELRARKEKRMSMKSGGGRRMSSASVPKDTGRKGSTTSSSAEEEVAGQSLAGGPRIQTTGEPPPRFVKRKDSQARELPAAERAPLPRSASAASASKS